LYKLDTTNFTLLILSGVFILADLPLVIPQITPAQV
jgi:hypothetical protein